MKTQFETITSSQLATTTGGGLVNAVHDGLEQAGAGALVGAFLGDREGTRRGGRVGGYVGAAVGGLAGGTIGGIGGFAHGLFRR